MSALKKRTTLQPKREKESIVEKIVSRRKRNRKLYYLVKWQGCDESENSWELAENLECHEMMKVYEENRKIEFRKRLSLRQYKSRMSNTNQTVGDIAKSELSSNTDETDKENSLDNKTELKSPIKFEKQISKDSNSKEKETKSDNEIKDQNVKKREENTVEDKEILANESVIEKQKETAKTIEILKNDVANLKTSQESEQAEELTISSTQQSEQTEEVTISSSVTANNEQDDKENSFEIINDKYLVTDFLTRDSVQTGFEKGLEVECILGATKVKNDLYLVLKFHEENEPQLIVADIVKEKIPQMVIQFYESCLSWESDDDDEEMKM